VTVCGGSSEEREAEWTKVKRKEERAERFFLRVFIPSSLSSEDYFGIRQEARPRLTKASSGSLLFLPSSILFSSSPISPRQSSRVVSYSSLLLYSLLTCRLTTEIRLVFSAHSLHPVAFDCHNELHEAFGLDGVENASGYCSFPTFVWILRALLGVFCRPRCRRSKKLRERNQILVYNLISLKLHG
jgi:hypothetical protein